MLNIKKSNDFEILKVNEESRLVYGWASVSKVNDSSVVDGEGDIIDTLDLEKAAADFVITSRIGGDNHIRKGVSDLTASVVFTSEIQKSLGIDLKKEGWFVGFYVRDDVVWENIKKGEYASFSIGGVAEREEIE